MKKNQGFTLLEIIIVIIIIGVLTSLALPRLSQMVKAANAPEAIQFFNTIHSSIQRCILMSGQGKFPDSNDCMSFANLDIENPFLDPRSHFYFGSSSTSLSTSDGRGTGYCYKLSAGLKNGAPEDFLVFQYCDSDRPTSTGGGCFGSGPAQVCMNSIRGVTIVGAGVFSATRIGPGVIP